MNKSSSLSSLLASAPRLILGAAASALSLFPARQAEAAELPDGQNPGGGEPGAKEIFDAEAPGDAPEAAGPAVSFEALDESPDADESTEAATAVKARKSKKDKKAEKEKEKAASGPKPWRHPQAWAPLEISFYLALLPFLFWPLAGAWGILYVYSRDVQNISLEELKNFNPPTVSYIYAADQTPLAELYREHRLVLPLKDIPPMVVEAFLAAEDSAFYQHQGVDLVGMVRAAIANFRAGRAVQGASTITQQMIRTFLLSNEKTMDRKLREMVLSWRAEQILTKDEILYLYLNRIYLGRGAYGVESAARLYFGKGIAEVSLAEASFLAGLVKAPGRMGANLGSARSLERQHYVIGRMAAVGFITEAQGRMALSAPLEFIKFRPNLYRETAPQFTEVVRRQAIELLGEDALLNDGVKITTTIDLQAQAWAEEAVRNGLDALAHRQRMSPRVARLNPNQAIDHQSDMREKLEHRPLLSGQESPALVTKIIDDGPAPGLEMALGDEKGFMPLSSIKWYLGTRKLSQYFAVGDLVMVRLTRAEEEPEPEAAPEPAPAEEENAENASAEEAPAKPAAAAEQPARPWPWWDCRPAPPPDLQGALVLVENKTGAIKAIVGGRDFGQTQFNRAIQARRQPGSSFKPIVYTAAMDNGYTEASVVYDTPTSFSQGPGMPAWIPKNYSGRNSGPLTLYDAILSSVNVVAVKVCNSITPQVVADYARRMGINSPLTPTLSLALGASEVTLMELTTAYTTFPNLGSWAWPIFISKIEDRHGQVVKEYQPYLTPAISPQTAYIMIDMLSGVATRGTAARVGGALKRPVAGKTGTTNDQADALFVGFTPEYTCGVWVGRDIRISLGGGEQGGRSAVPIFIELMTKFLENVEPGKFETPPGVVRESLDGKSFVFKAGEVGRGRVDAAVPVASERSFDAEASRNLQSMTQEELDRRLLNYLQDYERRRGQ